MSNNLHDWQFKGLNADGKRLWVCDRCKIFARLLSDWKLPPLLLSDLHPCDEMVVKLVMDS